jgi:hypothetical protein
VGIGAIAPSLDVVFTTYPGSPLASIRGTNDWTP